MVVILRKKKSLNQASASHSPSLDGSVDKQHRNQLLEPVSPFEECHEYSSRFTQASVFVDRVIRRKHSTQRRQLAQVSISRVLSMTLQTTTFTSTQHPFLCLRFQLKTDEVLRAAAKLDSDTTVPPLESLVTGLLSSPARTKPDTSDLTKPIDLLHQGRPFHDSSSNSNRPSVFSTSSNAKYTSSNNKMHSGASHRRNINHLFRPRTLTEMFASRGCYSSYCPGACSCVVPPGAHQVPCIISITNLDDFDDDASSEISSEDVFLYMSTSTNTTGQTSTEQLMGTDATHPTALPKSCLSRATMIDSESTVSSISWPSDEDDSETGCNETCSTNDVEENQEDSQLVKGHSSLQLITEIRNLACSEEASLRMLDAGCGFKFWSEVYPKPAIEHRNDAVDISASRDEHEEIRCGELDENKDREEGADTRCSF